MKDKLPLPAEATSALSAVSDFIHSEDIIKTPEEATRLFDNLVEIVNPLFERHSSGEKIAGLFYMHIMTNAYRKTLLQMFQESKET